MRRSIHDNLPLIHQNDAIRSNCLLHEVRDIDDRCPLLFVQFFHGRKNFRASAWIQHSCGLVQDNTLRLHSDSTRDSNTLLLSSGKQMRCISRMITHPD